MTVAFSAALLVLLMAVPSTPLWVVQGGVFLSFGLWLLGTVVGVVVRSGYPRIPKESALKVIDLVMAAAGIHREFATTGPVSAPHLRRSIEELRSKGMVRPGALWAQLDDVERQGVAVL